MNPRSLRHRLEKIAKLLVIVQKYTSEANCVVDQDKGREGHLVVDLADIPGREPKLAALGKALEDRGYHFTEKKSFWLGQITYTGRTDDKPTIVLSMPITIDRLAINDEAPETPYLFLPTR